MSRANRRMARLRRSQASLDDRIGLGGLAAVTGGFALTGSNNYTAAFERLVRENSTYYLLAFNSGVEKRDGRYVRLEVHVKRPGLQVQSTEGYVQPRGKQQQPPRRPSTVLAATWDAVASGITTSGLPMRVSAAPFRRDKDKGATVAITRRSHRVEAQSGRRGRGLSRCPRSGLRGDRCEEEEVADLSPPRRARAQARDLRAREPRCNPRAVAAAAPGRPLPAARVRGRRRRRRERRLRPRDSGLQQRLLVERSRADVEAGAARRSPSARRPD